MLYTQVIQSLPISEASDTFSYAVVSESWCTFQIIDICVVKFIILYSREAGLQLHIIMCATPVWELVFDWTHYVSLNEPFLKLF